MQSINISNDGLSVNIDGITYYRPTDLPKEPELKTFQDCWNKVRPIFMVDSGNNIREVPTFLTYDETTSNQLPTEKSAKQIQAAIKLFVIMYALQGDWEQVWNEERYYSVRYNGTDLDVHTFACEYSPFVFKTGGLAKKSIDIAGDIWLEFFGVEKQ